LNGTTIGIRKTFVNSRGIIHLSTISKSSSNPLKQAAYSRKRLGFHRNAGPSARPLPSFASLQAKCYHAKQRHNEVLKRLLSFAVDVLCPDPRYAQAQIPIMTLARGLKLRFTGARGYHDVTRRLDTTVSLPVYVHSMLRPSMKRWAMMLYASSHVSMITFFQKSSSLLYHRHLLLHPANHPCFQIQMWSFMTIILGTLGLRCYFFI
jgi:hypothetical protein